MEKQQHHWFLSTFPGQPYSIGLFNHHLLRSLKYKADGPYLKDEKQAGTGVLVKDGLAINQAMLDSYGSSCPMVHVETDSKQPFEMTISNLKGNWGLSTC